MPDGPAAEGPVIEGPAGVALVAVGGYGRRELAPHSDLDLVLIHQPGADVEELAKRLWYPLWDAAVRIDHAVRARPEATAAAAQDVRVALGLLDSRHVAGDPAVTLRLRAEVLAQWRRDARRNLPRLRRLVHERGERAGELAHASVPDLKESVGGLRDATVLGALVATWLVDVPQTDLERSRRQLLDVRDAVQEHTGRATDRITPELWRPVTERLGLGGEEEAQWRVRALGRRITHLSRLTWSRVDRLLAEPGPGRAGRNRQPGLVPVARGVAVADGEVVLAADARPEDDAGLLLRAAAAAAERRLVLSPPSAARLLRDGAPMPDPWPTEARDGLVRLLAAGPGLLPVWETLDETGAVERVLPEWQRIQLLPHASAVHRFTVDRHVVETCVQAAALIRRVARPDLLLVAALLHDIGKGGTRDHSVVGEPIARAAAQRMGFGAADTDVVGRLVRHHLLLAHTATTRDLDDPATLETVARRVGTVETLELLAALTEADAQATSNQAWTRWRATLVAALVKRVRALLRRGPASSSGWTETRLAVPEPVGLDPAHLEVTGEPAADGTRIRVVGQDRVGLLADVSGALAVLRIPVRSVRAATGQHAAVSVWDVAEPEVDPTLVAQRIAAVASGSVRPADRLRTTRPTLPPSVLVHHEASRDATVLEVRSEDIRGVIHLVCRALADLDVSVRSAHAATIGPQAVDVFYLQETAAAALSDERAAAAAHAVRRALESAVTLER